MNKQIKARANVQRLIANDVDDCRGLVNSLFANGYIVWKEKVINESGKTNVVVCFTEQETRFEIYTAEELRTLVPIRYRVQCEKDPECAKEGGHVGHCADDLGFAVPNDDEPQEDDEQPTTEDEPPAAGADPEPSESERCIGTKSGNRCILQPNHPGDCLYRCASKLCPGYPWIASETPHPKSTCK